MPATTDENLRARDSPLVALGHLAGEEMLGQELVGAEAQGAGCAAVVTVEPHIFADVSESGAADDAPGIVAGQFDGRTAFERLERRRESKPR
jgi:hypothetical protein